MLHGQFRNKDSPDFTGQISDDCNGLMNFSDKGLISFVYDEETYRIFWYNRNAGDVWNKGN